MLALKIAFLVLLPTTFAAISIEVNFDGWNDYTTNLRGENFDLINDVERREFHLTDEIMLDAARRFFGGRPITVYFRDPTGNSNRYAQWNLQPVRVRTTPLRASLVANRVENLDVMRHEFVNEHPTLNSSFSVALETTVENTVHSSWYNIREVNIEKSIGYRFRFGGGSASLTYDSEFGESMNATQTGRLSVANTVGVHLMPGERAVVTMVAFRRTMDLNVDYQSSLSGVSLTWYRLIRYGKQWWDHDVRQMLSAAYVPIDRYPRETMRAGYFFNGEVNVVYYRNNNIVREEKIPAVLKFPQEQSAS